MTRRGGAMGTGLCIRVRIWSGFGWGMGGWGTSFVAGRRWGRRRSRWRGMGGDECCGVGGVEGRIVKFPARWGKQLGSFGSFGEKGDVRETVRWRAILRDLRRGG